MAEALDIDPDTPLDSVLGHELARKVVRLHSRLCPERKVMKGSPLKDFLTIPISPDGPVAKRLPSLAITRADVKEWAVDSLSGDPHALTQERIEAVTAAEKADKADQERPRLWAAVDLHASQQREWLATGHVPKSAVTLLVGDEGIGKSLWWVWLLYYVTTGKPSPEFGIPAREPADVIIVATEDDWATTVLPRMEVAKVDLTRVHVIATEQDGSGSPTFPEDFVTVRDAADKTKPALIVIDAWLDTVSSKLSVRDPQQARQALHPWKELATGTGAAVLLLTHTNRVSTANARDKYGATAELRKKARMTLFAQADPDDDTCMIVGPEKSNIARAAEATRFRKKPVQRFEPTDEDDGTVPLLEYVGLVGKSSRDLIAEAFHGPEDDDANDTNEFDDAMEWLRWYLVSEHKGNQVAGRVVKAAAKAEGHKERTLQRAAKALNVKYTKKAEESEEPGKTLPATSHWELPDLSFSTEESGPVDDHSA
ncbi:AAA family ATPase [Nocardia sp. NPDC049737]|uniref:AAA family ATPase n=1 Tax=Nocardia sp. NPDC049737 TaxID=3154358 RepID=UPI00343560F3